MSLMADDDFNDEIVEIFVEEVDEVLELIDSNYPAWKDNADNDAALKEVRRAFHTLKGSGRMVQAEEIGEVAWSVENMLNRILDKTLPISPSVYDLITDVRDSVPILVTAFKNRQAAALAGVNYAQLIERAESIVAGKDAVALGSLDSSSSDSVDNIAELHADSSINDAEVAQLKAQIAEMQRDLVAVSTQLDTMSTKLNLMPKATSTEEVDARLNEFASNLETLQGSIQSRSDQLVKDAEEARQKLASKFEKDLKMVEDLTGQLKADFNHEVNTLSSKVTAIAIKWSVLAAATAGVAVYLTINLL